MGIHKWPCTSCTSTHPTMVTQKSMSCLWMDDSHLFRSLSIGRPIPDIRLFQTLTLKLQGQVHRCGQGKGNTFGPVPYQFASFFISHQSDQKFLRIFRKLTLQKSKIKVLNEVQGPGHITYPISNPCTSLSSHNNWTNHSWDMAIRVLDFEKHIRNVQRKFAQKV